MTKPTLYTVARSDGEYRQYNLTLHEAARAILHDDGKDYQFRLSPDREFRRDLWVKDNNSDWRLTSIFSVEKNYSAAKSDIFQQVVEKSGCDGWTGLVATRQEDYLAMLDRMRAEEDDPECIARIDAEIAEINT